MLTPAEMHTQRFVQNAQLLTTVPGRHPVVYVSAATFQVRFHLPNRSNSYVYIYICICVGIYTGGNINRNGLYGRCVEKLRINNINLNSGTIFILAITCIYYTIIIISMILVPCICIPTIHNVLIE